MSILNQINNPNLLFLILTFLILTSAILIILSKNPIHSILFLVFVFIMTTILFLTLKVDFLAMLFLVLYVGAIVVLFLFVVMMLNVRILELNERVISYIPIGIVIIFIFFFLIISVINPTFLQTTIFFSEKTSNLNLITFEEVLNTFNNLSQIAHALYTDHVYSFLLAGLALLVAMIGAIVLTETNNPKTKRQDYYRQTNKDIDKAIRHLK